MHQRQAMNAAPWISLMVLFMSACASPEPQEAIQVTEGPRVAPTVLSSPSAPGGIVVLDQAPGRRWPQWPETPVTARFCGVSSLVTIQGGKGSAPSTVWGYVQLHGPSDGDQVTKMDGQPYPTALVPVSCSNGGGTAAGQIGFAFEIVQLRDGKLVSLGEATARYDPESASHTSLLVIDRVEGSTFTIGESFYRTMDATCCPSGRAETTWTIDNDGLRPSTTHIIG